MRKQRCEVERSKKEGEERMREGKEREEDLAGRDVHCEGGRGERRQEEDEIGEAREGEKLTQAEIWNARKEDWS